MSTHPDVQAFVTEKRITWRFNLEKAPWWGGFYERVVKGLKRCLCKTLGNERLSHDELLTLVIEVENTLNARPLTYVDTSTSDVWERPDTVTAISF